jgi:hypothetical protein
MKPNGIRLLIVAHAFDTGGGYLGFWKTRMIDCPQLMTSICWKSCSLTSLPGRWTHTRRLEKGEIFKSAPLSENHTRISKIGLICKSPRFICEKNEYLAMAGVPQALHSLGQ